MRSTRSRRGSRPRGRLTRYAFQLAVLGVILLLFSIEDLSTIYRLRWETHPPEQQALIEGYFRAAAFKENNQPVEALAELDAIVGKRDALEALSRWWKRRIYEAKADLHWELWHYIEAEEAWAEALRYADEKGRARIEEDIRRSRYLIEQVNDERNLRSQYRAAPHAGPAAAPAGRIAVISLFIEDGGPGSWGLRERRFVAESWTRVESWFQRTLAAYGSEATFSHRHFLVDRNMRIKRTTIAGFGARYRNEGEVIELAVQHLGSPNVQAFIEQVRREEVADQVILLFYLNRDDRSFAYRCLKRCDQRGEYAVLFGEAKRKRWQATEYVQAHETLHLFGADDLYQIRSALNFAPRDIMNYASSRLDGSTIEPVTAYGVGLLAKPPETPFEVITYK